MAFGLCDLGLGFPELGYVDVNDLIKTLGWRLERDMHFTADKTLSEYATAAHDKGNGECVNRTCKTLRRAARDGQIILRRRGGHHNHTTTRTDERRTAINDSTND